MPSDGEGFERRIVEEILRARPDLSPDDVERLVLEKVEKLGVSRKTALYLLCVELGVRLSSGVADYIEIGRIQHGLSRIRVVGRLLWLKGERYVESPRGRRPYVRGGIGDKTGVAQVVFWGYTRGELEDRGIVPGAIVDIAGASTRRGPMGLNEVHVGASAEVRVREDGDVPPIGSFLTRLDEAELSEGFVSVFGRVLTRLVRREYASGDRRGEYGSFILGAGSRAVRVVVWDLDDCGWVKPGDVVAIFNGRVKKGVRGEPEIHVGRLGHVEYLPGAGVEVKCEEASIAGLTDGFNLKTLLVEVYARGKERIREETGTKTVGLYVVDDTGDATLILAGEPAEESADIVPGSRIRVSSFRVSRRGGDTYIFCGDGSEVEVVERGDGRCRVPTKLVSELSTTDRVVSVVGRVVRGPEPAQVEGPAEMREIVIEDEKGDPAVVSYRGDLSLYADGDVSVGDNVLISAALLDINSIIGQGGVPVLRLRAYSRVVKLG